MFRITEDPSSGSLVQPKIYKKLWGPPNLVLNGYLGVKWPGREVQHSPPSNAEVKNKWSHVTMPSTCLHTEGGKNFNFY